MNAQLLEFLELNRFVPAEIDLADTIITILIKSESQKSRSNVTGGLAFEELFRQLRGCGAIYSEVFVEATLNKLSQAKHATKALPVIIKACDGKWHLVSAMV